MSTVSTQQAPKPPQEQEQSSARSLPGSLGMRWGVRLAVGSLLLAGAGAALGPHVVREVHLVNGLSQPVEVRLEGRLITLKPGEIAQAEVFSLGTPHSVEARFPGAEKPLEVLSLEASQRAVYNVLGAAAVQVADPSAPKLLYRLMGRTGSLQLEEQLDFKGGWAITLREQLQAGRAREAAALAEALFLADPTALQAGEEAALFLLRSEPVLAEKFARELHRLHPDNATATRIAQDVFIALGKRAEGHALYEQLVRQEPESVQRALMAARMAPPARQYELHTRLQEQFHTSPEARRALARIRLGYFEVREALNLLEEARVQAPESLADLELRVRALLSLRRFKEASLLIGEFSNEPRNRTWELAILAGRVARLIGPGHTQYVSRDLIPPGLKSSPEHMLRFALLTGDSTITEAELETVADPVLREALNITRLLFKDVDRAAGRAAAVADPVLQHLDPETAAVLALELARRKRVRDADRLFATSLALQVAHKPLLAYVEREVVTPELLLLPPDLRAAAYLVHSRTVRPGGEAEGNPDPELHQARQSDSLGGMARRALDPGYEERAVREEPSRFSSSSPSGHAHPHRGLCGTLLHLSDR